MRPTQLAWIAAAAVLVAGLPAASCRDTAEDGARPAEVKQFARWCEDLGALATVCSAEYKPSNNWYLPARVENLRLDQTLWARDLQQFGQVSLVAGNRTVFVASSTGYLSALDAATGETRWEKEKESPTERGGGQPQFHELALTEYSLVAGLDVDQRSEVRFYSPVNGELQRRHQLYPFELHTLLPTASGEVLAIAQSGDIRAFDAATGELLRSEKQLTMLAGAVVADDRLLFCGRERAVFSLGVADLRLRNLRMLRDLVPWMAYADENTLNLVCQMTAEDKHMLLGVAPDTLETVWQSEPLEVKVGMLPASIGPRMYYSDTEGTVRCYDTRKNALTWSHRMFCASHVFFTCENGVIAIANFSAQRAPAGEGASGSPHTAPPWYEPGHPLYYEFVMLDPDDGSVVYEHHAPGQFLARAFTEYGLIEREGVDGPLVCHPADVIVSGAGGETP